MRKIIVLKLIIYLFLIGGITAQGNSKKIDSFKFKIRSDDTIVTKSNGEYVNKQRLLFKNKTIELKHYEIYNLSQNKQIACVKDFFLIDDTTISILLYDTNGIVTNEFYVPSIASGVDVSNNGSFALIGPKPSKLTSEKLEPINLLLYDNNGNLIYRNKEILGPTYTHAFSNNGNIFAILVSTKNLYNDFIVKLIIIKNLDSNPKIYKANIDNWPERSSLVTSTISIVEENNIMKIFRKRVNESYTKFEKETLYFDLNGSFIKREKGWANE